MIVKLLCGEDMKNLIFFPLILLLESCLVFNSPEENEFLQITINKFEFETGDITVVKSDMPQRSFNFLLLDSNRIFFFGDPAGYYPSNSDIPIYFNFKASRYLLSNTQKYILFIKDDYSLPGVFLMNTATLQVTGLNIALKDINEENISFSHDDKKIIFTEVVENKSKVALNSFDLNTLTTTKIFDYIYEKNTSYRMSYPVLNSDGSRIFFMLNSVQGTSLSCVKVNDSSLIAVDNSSLGIYNRPVLNRIRPAWKAGLIYYSDNGGNIYVVNENGTNIVITGITDKSAVNNFKVSSDGKIVVCTDLNFNNPRINVYINRLKNFTFGGLDVTFSTDGRYLYYTGAEVKHQ